MIKVECVSCKAPYELDERRIPEKGMKMRCPKCGTSFGVTRQGIAAGGGAPAAAPAPAAPPLAPPPPASTGAVAPPFAAKGTMLGQTAAQPPPAPAAGGVAAPAPAAVAGPVARPAAGTMLGVAPQAPAGAGGAENAGAPRTAVAKGAFSTGVIGAPAQPARFPSIDVSDVSVSNIRIDQLPLPKREVDLQRPEPPPPLEVAPSFGNLDADLPAPKALALHAPPHAPARQAAGYDDADLPAPKAGMEPPRLAPKVAAPAAPLAFGDLDLPAAKLSADLPALKQGADLPALKQGADLPALKQGADLPASKHVADLPTPKHVADLPTPKHVADLPAPKFSADLPTPKHVADLPTPKHVADLPVAKGFGDLPRRAVGGVRFGEIDLPTPKAPEVDFPAPRNDLPVPKGDEASFADITLDLPDLPLPEETPEESFGDIELPPPKPAADIVVSREPTVQGVPRRVPTIQKPAQRDELDSELPPSLMADETSFGDLNTDESLDGPPAPKRSARATAAKAPAASMPPSLRGGSAPPDESDLLEDDNLVEEGEEYEEGDDFGEEAFAEGEGEGEGEEFADDEEMEFGISGDEAGRIAPDSLRRQRGEEFEARQAASRKRAITLLIRLAAALVLLTAGAASLMFTEYGIFGVYYWERWLPEASDAIFARTAIQKAEKIASSDTYVDIQRSLKELGLARGKAGINRALLTRGLLHEAFSVVRFGDNAPAAARAAAIYKRLQERSFHAPEAELAQAADAARRKNFAEANRFLEAARKQDPRDPYVGLLAGELGLAQGKLDVAEKGFAQALKVGGGARAQWGLARVALGREDKEAQVAAVNETLKLSPMHVDARIAEAQILWSQGKEDRAVHLLRVALGLEPTEEDRYLWSSKSALAGGYAVLGYVHEARGRLHLAREAYDKSLGADAYRVEALLGSGRVLLREGRPNDALPRFESAQTSATKSGVNPIVLSGRHADTEAQLGIGRVLLALQRGPEAKAKLLDLSQKLPNDAEVMLALGQTEEGLGNEQLAEEHLRKSISLAPTSFDGYLALSQLFFHKGDAAKASEVLNEAAAQVEETAHMRRMLGQSELARGRFDSAVHELKRALDLDPYDTEALFGLGVALRKRGDLLDAVKVFDDIAKRDPEFAGLAEQRGLVLEAQGQYADAVAAYQAALEKDPADMGLILRLGAAQVLAGSLDDAEQTLAKVIREMPNSAEAEYFIGRIAFGRGRTPDALSHFDRAIGLDTTRAEYHLYVARATYEMGNFGRSVEEVEVAIKRDPSLGDAYWVRAMIRLRTGAVRDALKDLDRAIRLNPARVEAHSVMGDCYEQLRQLPDAIKAYQTALDKDPSRGQWWYRLAVLSIDAGERGQGDHALKRAIELGDKQDPIPYWLADAYRLSGELAEDGKNRQLAIRHYKRYLEIAPSSSIDFTVVQRKLQDWGVELEEP